MEQTLPPVQSSPVASAAGPAVRACHCGRGRPRSRSPRTYAPTTAAVTRAAPSPNETRYSVPFTASGPLLAYLRGAMKLPLATPTYSASPSPARNRARAPARFLGSPPPARPSASSGAASGSGPPSGPMSFFRRPTARAPSQPGTGRASAPATAAVMASMPASMVQRPSAARGRRATGSRKTSTPQRNETKMDSPLQSICESPSPACCTAMMAATPFTTHTAAPSTPKPVKRTGWGRARYARPEHRAQAKLL